MKLGKVVGKIWCTAKEENLLGKRLYVVQPLNQDQKPVGDPLIAVDAVGAGEGQMVFWVTGREGCFPFLPEKAISSEATIVGIADTVNKNVDV
jgi:ethanolamine utilization protein EutN